MSEPLAYYNEIDPYAAQWLRNLIDGGHIARGIVDERSIEDVRPRDLDSFTQCHFFAGIGVWSYALRLAGWPDDRPVWTGSCPCQPFSSAGKGAGFADERHLWPYWHHLISEHRPAIVFGEQVASKDADPWIDLVQNDLEGMGHAFGAVPFPSAGVGAPHIRDRLYWVASADGHRRFALPKRGLHNAEHNAEPRRSVGRLGDDQCTGLAFGQRLARIPRGARGARGADAGQATERAGLHIGGLADVPSAGRGLDGQNGDAADIAEAIRAGTPEPGRGGAVDGAGPTNGLWRAADWLLCRDGKWRPVEPGAFPLAHGAPARVGRLRGYGNAICAPAAAEFVMAYANT